MAAGDLLAIIKAKQARIATLQAELDEARALLASLVKETAATGPGPAPRRRGRRRSAKMLDQSPTAREAATIIRAAGRPLHVTAIAKALNDRGHAVKLATLVSTLSRWVQSRSVFYRAQPNVFGLTALRAKSRPRTSSPAAAAHRRTGAPARRR